MKCGQLFHFRSLTPDRINDLTFIVFGYYDWKIGYTLDTNFSKRFLLVRRQNRYDSSTKPQEFNVFHDWYFKLTWSLFIILPLLPGSFEEKWLPNDALCLRHSYLPTLWTRRQLFCFLCFFGFLVFLWGGEGGREGVEWNYLLHYSVCSSLSTNPVFLQLSVFLPS